MEVLNINNRKLHNLATWKIPKSTIQSVNTMLIVVTVFRIIVSEDFFVDFFFCDKLFTGIKNQYFDIIINCQLFLITCFVYRFAFYLHCAISCQDHRHICFHIVFDFLLNVHRLIWLFEWITVLLDNLVYNRFL